MPAYDPRSYWGSLHEAHPGRLSAVGYAAMGEGFNRATYRLRLSAAERLLRRTRAPLERLLEGGVGVGAYEPLWRRLGVRSWTGLDISPAAIADLQRKFPSARFLAADLTSADGEWLAGESYDLVTAIDVLYHVVEEEPFRAALRNLATRVRPGGGLLVSDVFCAHGGEASHVKRRPLAAYEEVLSPLGFRLADREPIFGLLGAPCPRPGLHPVDRALEMCWRVLQKAVRSTPGPLRDAVGAAVTHALAPVDRVIAATGVTRGVNLELAFFRTSWPH